MPTREEKPWRQQSQAAPRERKEEEEAMQEKEKERRSISPVEKENPGRSGRTGSSLIFEIKIEAPWRRGRTMQWWAAWG